MKAGCRVNTVHLEGGGAILSGRQGHCAVRRLWHTHLVERCQKPSGMSRR